MAVAPVKDLQLQLPGALVEPKARARRTPVVAGDAERVVRRGSRRPAAIGGVVQGVPEAVEVARGQRGVAGVRPAVRVQIAAAALLERGPDARALRPAAQPARRSAQGITRSVQGAGQSPDQVGIELDGDAVAGEVRT